MVYNIMFYLYIFDIISFSLFEYNMGFYNTDGVFLLLSLIVFKTVIYYCFSLRIHVPLPSARTLWYISSYQVFTIYFYNCIFYPYFNRIFKVIII
ncbi:hypothetical protein SLOPH_783 [Spraguea lophii 42_110]|uniref:Uncharacterized protein n=1 Tax=Spraguea lophii (strain 42_110) TaxID=1358809 RepID=S7W9D9_SPRLO|nr:hypothetical protein SLOPH_783 [Spraguea lophii 42_110]